MLGGIKSQRALPFIRLSEEMLFKTWVLGALAKRLSSGALRRPSHADINL